MHIDPYILTFSAVTVIATIWMGFAAARKSKTTSDFFVAGRSVSVGWNASAISGEYLSAASFMGVAGMVMSVGYDALWYPVCYACGYLFLLLFIAGPLRRFGAYTVPDLAEGRFDSPVFRKIAVVFVLFIGFFYTMPQMKGAGTTLAYIFPGLPYWVGVVLVGAIITLNVALGGMKGITLVQAVQYWAKMFAISVPIFVLMAVYGGYGKQLEENSPNTTAATTGSLELFLPQTWKVTAINGNSNELILKLNEAKAAVSRSFGKPSLQAGNFDALRALRLFAANHGYHRMLMAQSAPTYSQMTNPISVTTISTAEKWEQDVRAGLRSNGVDVIVASDALVVVPVAKHAEYEAEYGKRGMSVFVAEQTFSPKPLPEKAPADSTWLSLSPAEGDATNQIAVSTSMSLPVVNGWVFLKSSPIVSRAEERLKAFFGQGQHYSVSNAKLVSVLLEYRELSGRTIIVHTNVGLTRMLGPLELNWNDWGKTLASVEQFLATNGVALRTESPNNVRAMTPEQATLWDQQAQLTTRRALPEKAPADSTWLSPFGPLTTKAAKAAGIIGEAAKPFSLLYTYSLIIALVCGTAGLPHILVRFYTNPDGVAAKRTTMWVMILIGVFYVFPPVFGVMGRNLLPELYNGIGAKGTDKIVLELPRLLNEKYAPLGSILSGVTCAGAFAAFMSTFSGLLVSMTGAMAHDVYGRMLNPKASAEQRLRAFKVAAVIVGGIAILLGTQVETLEINFMVGQAFAIAAASYFPFLFMCAWWRNLTMKGAATGMLTGGLLALIGITLTSISDIALKTSKANGTPNPLQGMQDFWAGHPGIRIISEQPAIWAVPLAIVLMIIVSKITRKDVPADIRKKMLVLHAPEKLGLKQEYIQEHQAGH